MIKTYFKPSTVDEALDIASNYQDNFKYIAGGTDVMVVMGEGNLKPGCLVDVSAVSELQESSVDGEYFKIGAGIVLDRIKSIETIYREFPVLVEAANAVGSPLIRKTATLGGNLLCENRCLYYNQQEWWRDAVGRCLKCEGDRCIASGGKNACFSEAVSDTAPALISMRAKLEILGFDGKSTVELADIYTGNGVQPINLGKGALITSILLPLDQEFIAVFNKLRQRASLDFTSLTSAVTIDKNGGLIISMTGVDPKPLKVEGTRESEPGQLVKEALRKARAIDNEMQSRKYRRKMVKQFIESSLKELGWNV